MNEDKDDSKQHLLADYSIDAELQLVNPRLTSRQRQRLQCQIGIALLGAATSFFAIGFMVGFSYHSNLWAAHGARICLAITSRPSPITNVHYSTVEFNGSLLKENVFRQDAGPEADAAWEALGVDYRPLVIPTSEAESLGLRLDQVQIHPSHGGGFPVNIEGLHHLHCLNLLRQALYWNYEYYHFHPSGPFLNDDFILKKHVTHCLDILRQQLMCTIDIGVMGQVWYQQPHSDQPEPFVDFNTKHICRNFEAVRKWAEERQIDEKVPKKGFLKMPEEGDRVYSEIP